MRFSPRLPRATSSKMATDLVRLPEVERLSPACIRVLGGNPGKFTLQGTNTYLVGTGRRRLLIDTAEGRPAWAAALRRTLEDERATVSAALLTHRHHDHVGGVADLLRLCPGARVYKSHPDAAAGQLDISDGQVFRVEGASLRAVHTPGHTADHVVLVLEEEDAMFTGDNVLGQGTAVFEDLGVYLDSLAKMGPLFGGRAYPGHGPVVADGPGRIREYIHHRRQREEQVVQALRSRGAEDDDDEHDNNSTAMGLVRVIYRDVPESLWPAAERGVLQILAKLEREGKVERDGGAGRWRPKDRHVL